jgi:hypothetical protein
VVLPPLTLIAQRTEHLTTDQKVGSSNLPGGTLRTDARAIDKVSVRLDIWYDYHTGDLSDSWVRSI